MPTKVDASSAAPIQKAANLTPLFHARLSETPKKPAPAEEEKGPEKGEV